ncbi:unnamed protein product [Meloidogyne enterolobii]|uniref:Uncharacterized protein n=1 Tax=Meloidogyne enterolobii TaxID=390850 RepID=A0ACB1AKJ9_MELEN
MPQKESLVNVQTQMEENEMGLRRYTNEDQINENNNSVEVVNVNATSKDRPLKRLICCCNSNEVEGLNADEFPEGCKKRPKLLLENEEQQRDKNQNKSLTPPSPKINKEDKEKKKKREIILYLEEDEVVQVMKMNQLLALMTSKRD